VTKSISFGLSSQTRVTIIGELSLLRAGNTSYFDIANLEDRAWEIASAKFQNLTKRALGRLEPLTHALRIRRWLTGRLAINGLRTPNAIFDG
jgi:hypothetical protein